MGTIILLFLAVAPLLAEGYARSAMQTHHCSINPNEPKPIIHCDDEERARTLQQFFDASIFFGITGPFFGIPGVLLTFVTVGTGVKEFMKKKKVLAKE